MCSGFSQTRNGVSSRKHSTLLYFSHSHVRWKITLVDVVKSDMSIMELTKSMTSGRDWFVEGQYPTQLFKTKGFVVVHATWKVATNICFMYNAPNILMDPLH